MNSIGTKFSERGIMSNTEPFLLLKKAVNKAQADLKEIGGSNSLREKLGVEVHLKCDN